MAVLSTLINGALPAAYVGRTTGAVTKSGDDLIVPALTVFVEGREYNIAETTMSPDLPSFTVITTSGATIAYPAQPQHLAKINLAVVNNSGGAVSGTVIITGDDERGFELTDTVTIASVANGGNSSTVSNKYFAEITSVSLTGTLGNSGNVITGTEYQFRGHVKASADGLEFAWDNTFAEGETHICTFEVLATGILSVQDWREVAPLNKAQRVGSEIVNWSGGAVDGLRSDWLGNCVYAIEELPDGRVVAAGNSAKVAVFDGQRWGAAFTLGDLTSSDHILCLKSIKDARGNIKVYAGTVTGKLVAWDVTAGTTTTLTLGGSWTSGKSMYRIVKGSSRSELLLAGQSAGVMSITDNGASAPTLSSRKSNVAFPTGDDIYAAAFYDRHYYVGGGAGTGMLFYRFDPRAGSGQSMNLTPYMPGTNRARGTTSSAASAKMMAIASRPDGKLLLVGTSSAGGLYLAEWDTLQQFATGRVTFTVTGTVTIPAGFEVGDGTRSYRTIEEVSRTGAGSVSVRVVAVDPGDAGFAAAATVTTLVDADPVGSGTTVTNPEPMGMGRVLTDRDWDDNEPYALISNTPLDAAWTGLDWMLAMQGGDVLRHDGAEFTSLTEQVSFKGRATCVAVTTRCIIVAGDEGRVFSLPC